MSLTTKTVAANTLEKAGEDLQWLLKTTEDAIAGLVTSFHGLTEQADTVLTLSAAIVDHVEDRSVRSVLSNVQALGVAAKGFVGQRLRATAGILETVTAEMQLLRKLSIVTDGQAKIALQIKVLNVHTKIEVAHLGAVGVSFEYLAQELADFSNSLARSTDELIRHTNDRKGAIEKTRHMFAVELPQLTEELARIEVNLSDDLAALQAGLTRLSLTPAQFRTSAEEISRQIAGVVVAVQGHDITRQQIEHVQEALDVISRGIFTEEPLWSGNSREAVCAHAGLAIQISQLRAIKSTIAEWTSQVRVCTSGILRISASDLVEIGPLVLEQERTMSSQLSHIELLEQECLENSGRIRATLEGIANLSQLVTEHLQKSETARNRLQLLTFNSIIEASRLGEQADTICVIADGIAEVSVEWSRITEQSASALQEILSLSQRINEVMATFSQTGEDGLGMSQAQMKVGLESLRSASAFAVAQGQRIGAATDAMRSMSSDAGKIIDLLDACYAKIDSVLAELEQVRFRLEADNPGVMDDYDHAEIERLFSANYTTQAERAVMQAVLYGTESPVALQCSTGNDVELF